MTGFNDIAFSPFFPWWIIAPLAAGSALLVLFALWRRARGVTWRALVLAVAIAALTNPALIAEDREGLPDVAVVVVDESQSQGIGNRRAQTEKAAAEVTERLESFGNLEVRVVRVGSAAAAAGRDAGTLLFRALSQTLSDVPPNQVAGVIFITDGQVHDTPEQPDQVSLGAPLHVLLTGSREEGDRRLIVKQAPSYGIVGGDLVLTVRVEDTAAQDGGAAGIARIRLSQDGGPARTHRVVVGRDATIFFTLDHGGTTIVELEVEAGPGELTLQNNRAAISVSGVRDRLRVLLVSGQPHAGERTWRNLLKADPSVDLVHFTILRPPEKQDGTSVRELSLIAFPTRELFEVKLDDFDLIIFDRYRRRGVLLPIYVDNIARFVEAGGALLEAAGPAFASPLSLYRTPLGRILPAAPTGKIYEQGFRPALTEKGRRHPVTAELEGRNPPGGEPTWGRWFRMIEAELTGGTALLDGPNGAPLLVLARVGEGRVAQLLSDHAWLWARGFEGGGPQAEMLRRVAHWLMKEPDLEEENLRATAVGNRIAIERRSLEPDGPPVTITSPSGLREEVVLEEQGDGRAIATYVAGETGLFRLDDGTHTAVAAVGAINPREFADVRATADLLRPIAAAKGGKIIWLAERSVPDLRRVRPGRPAFGREWIGLVANDAYFVTGVRQASLFPPLALLLLVLGGLMVAWRREGR